MAQQLQPNITSTIINPHASLTVIGVAAGQRGPGRWSPVSRTPLSIWSPHWLEVDAMTRPIVVREERASYD